MRRAILCASCVLAFLLLSFMPSEGQQYSGLQSTTFTVSGSAAVLSFSGSGTAFHQLTWTTTGSPICAVTFDSSPDSSVWTTGGVIASQNCGTTGQSVVTAGTVNYGRVTVTLSGSGTVTVVWTGYRTVTSVGISNPGDVLYTVSNSPVTGSGTLTLTPNTQLANTVFGNFTGSAAVPTFSSAPTFSAINLTNFPTLNQSTSGTAATATNALSLGGSLANTYAPLANPTFTGAVTLPSANFTTGIQIGGAVGTAGQVLQSNGTTTSWVTPAFGMVYPGIGIAYTANGTSWGTSLTKFGTEAGLATSADPGAVAEVPMVADGTHGQKPSASGALGTGAFATIGNYATLLSPTFTGTVTIPTGASITGYLTTASASSTYAPLANPTFTGAVSASGLISANGGLSVTPLTSSANAAYMIPWQGATAQGTGGQIYTTTGFTFNPVTGSMSLPGGLVTTGTVTSGNVATNEIAVTTLITPATLTSSTLTIGGTLAPGTYYYRHWDIDSAAGGSCAGTVGSTLPSTQTSQVVPAGTSTNTVTLTLTATNSTATGHCVAGRTTGAELLMTPTPLAANVLTFTDNGSVTPSGALPTANTTGIIQAASLTGGLTGGASGLTINSSNTAGQSINFQIGGVTKMTMDSAAGNLFPATANNINLGKPSFDYANVYTRVLTSSALSNVNIFPSNGSVGWTFLGNISSAGFHLVPTAASTMNLGSVALPVWTVFSGTAGGNVGYDDLSAGMTTSAMSAQSSATCTNITGMTWTIAANKNYLLKCDIPMTWAATATAAFCLYGPGTASGYSLSAEGPLGAAGVYAQISTLAQTTWDGSIKTTASGAVAGSGIAHVWAGIRNGATPSGTALTLGTAANGAQNITVGANAICTLTQTN